MDVIRTCIGCRGKAAKAALVRYVRGDDGALVRDDAQRLPGRGAYVHPGAECWDTARKRRAFGRALRSDVRVTDPSAPVTSDPA